jgi:hypothetical protein
MIKLTELLKEDVINEGTRSQVGIIDRSGKIASAYVHFADKDVEYYNEKSQPMKGNFKDIGKYIKSADMKGGAEFVYLYNMKDRKWYYADTYKDSQLKKLF